MNDMTNTELTAAESTEVLLNMNEAVVNGEVEMTNEVATEVVVEAPKKVVRKRAPRRRSSKKVAAVPVVESSISFGGSYSTVAEEEPLGVIDQIRTALKNPLATFAGFVLGGFVPVATFSVSHLDKTLNEYVMWALVLGGLIYSALTVFTWAKNAFGHAVKAFGFVVLIEGVMTLSGLPELSYAALALLVLINGIATGATLSLKGSRVKV